MIYSQKQQNICDIFTQSSSSESPEGDESNFAAKRLDRTAQGFNPGSGWLLEGALKVAPDVGRVDGIIRKDPKDALRPPLSGRISARLTQG